MKYRASEVLNSEMMGYVRRGRPFRREVDPFVAEQRRQERLERARRMFPGVSDWEALDRLQDLDDERR